MPGKSSSWRCQLGQGWGTGGMKPWGVVAACAAVPVQSCGEPGAKRLLHRRHCSHITAAPGMPQNLHCGPAATALLSRSLCCCCYCCHINKLCLAARLPPHHYTSCWWVTTPHLWSVATPETPQDPHALLLCRGNKHAPLCFTTHFSHLAPPTLSYKVKIIWNIPLMLPFLAAFPICCIIIHTPLTNYTHESQHCFCTAPSSCRCKATFKHCYPTVPHKTSPYSHCTLTR